jgi:alpha-L-rhamnosidase
MQLFDSREFFRKWMCDILDCQSPDTGHIQHTAPFQGGGGGPGGW